MGVVNVSPNERFSAPYFLEPNMDSIISYGEICDSLPDFRRAAPGQDEHRRRCRLRKLWGETRTNYDSSASAEEILERFYRASGQLKVRGSLPCGMHSVVARRRGQGAVTP